MFDNVYERCFLQQKDCQPGDEICTTGLFVERGGHRMFLATGPTDTGAKKQSAVILGVRTVHAAVGKEEEEEE